MPIICNAIIAKQTAITLILTVMATAIAVAQQPVSESSQHSLPQSQSPMQQPIPATPPGIDKPPRAVHRIGTAIGAPRNSVSIKSTDAGIIHRQPPAAGCSNCGIVNFVNRIGQGPGLNAIAGGIVAGTIAREVLQQSQHHPGIIHPETGDHHPINPGGNIAAPGNIYQIGVTMSDGRQAVVNLPDATHFQQGDRVKWVDGALVLDR